MLWFDDRLNHHLSLLFSIFSLEILIPTSSQMIGGYVCVDNKFCNVALTLGAPRSF